MRVITLTTDFGLSDWFVGAMKGVITSIAPGAQVIDLTHGLPPGDIQAGAFALGASYRFFPKGTIHVVVVDPGVGSSREGLVVQTADYYFVGPDNGVLSLALRSQKSVAGRLLRDSRWFLHPVSRTFHGRDVFAPVAAHLSRGVPVRRFGPPAESLVQLDWPEPITRKEGIEGQVIYVDRFGNGITNVPAEWVGRLRAHRCTVHARRIRICPVRDFYQAVPAQAAVAVPGSSGFLEIAVNGGSARDLLGLERGTRISLRPE